MKNVIVFLMVILVCSCRTTIDSSTSGNSHKMTRHDEILKIMREDYIRALETAPAYLVTDRLKDELRRLKKDYFAEVKNPDVEPILVIPGRGWEIRGPLTFKQFEEERIKSYEELLEWRKKVHGIIETFEDSGMGKDCTRFNGKYREGDEIYFYKSDERSWNCLCGEEGYVLIRKNKIVDRILTRMN